MREFDSWQSYWRFARDVRRHSRYIRDEKSEKFLNLIGEQAQHRMMVLNRDAILWRARLGSEMRDEVDSTGLITGEFEVPFSPEQMKPLRCSALEGRANPVGISALYLADDEATALSEVRPWVGAHISVGRFFLNRDQTVVDCVGNTRFSKIFLSEPSAEKKEEAVWGHIGQAFAKPITRDDLYAEYVPTQILAEVFKRAGFDGVRYRSSVGDGHNVVLFNIDSATLFDCRVFEVSNIRYKYLPCAASYVVTNTDSE
jgi:RES domain-containing protein